LSRLSLRTVSLQGGYRGNRDLRRVVEKGAGGPSFRGPALSGRKERMSIGMLDSTRAGTGPDALSDARRVGEPDDEIFDCPACRRPLSVGSPRCPGCGTRLIAGVQAGRALSFVAVGLIIGLVIGGGTIAVASSLTATNATADGTATPTMAPATSTAPLVTPAPVAGPDVPTAALSALRQTALVNQRIVADAALLASALAASEPSSADIARALRSMSTDATYAARITADIGDWTVGGTVAGEMGAFYEVIQVTASEVLGASLNNDAAYVAGARAMLDVVDEVWALDGAARTLAARVDVELPAVVAPGESAEPTAP
jgi:hypothetical protein